MILVNLISSEMGDYLEAADTVNEQKSGCKTKKSLELKGFLIKNTRSNQITEVKQRWALSVLKWMTSVTESDMRSICVSKVW